MDHAEQEFNRRGFNILQGLAFHFILGIAEGGIHAGTLAEAVAVANSSCVTLNAGIVAVGIIVNGVSVHVAEVGGSRTTEGGNTDTEAETEAISTIVGGSVIAVFELTNTGILRTNLFGVLEILAAEVDLSNLEVVVTADGNRQTIVHSLVGRSGRPSGVVGAVNDADEGEAGANELGTNAVGTVGAGFVFNTGSLVVFLRSVLGINRQTTKRRSHISDGIVIFAKTVGRDKLKAAGGISPTSREGACHTEQTVGAKGAGELAETTECNATKGAFNKELGFTVEQTIILVAESTGIGGETVFKDEANLNAVTEVFRTLQAEAGAAVRTASKLC